MCHLQNRSSSSGVPHVTPWTQAVFRLAPTSFTASSFSAPGGPSSMAVDGWLAWDSLRQACQNAGASRARRAELRRRIPQVPKRKPLFNEGHLVISFGSFFTEVQLSSYFHVAGYQVNLWPLLKLQLKRSVATQIGQDPRLDVSLISFIIWAVPPATPILWGPDYGLTHLLTTSNQQPATTSTSQSPRSPRDPSALASPQTATAPICLDPGTPGWGINPW